MQEAQNELSAPAPADHDALSRLLEDAGRQVRQQLAGKMPQRWQAVIAIDDVMQVTYLEAFLRIGRFHSNGPGSFEAWLKAIAENNLRDAIRALERTKSLPPAVQGEPRSFEDSCVALLDVLAGSGITPSRHAARTEACGLVKAAVSELPPDYQHVLEMFDLQGRPASQIAAEMGRSEGAIYMLRARAQDHLRELLGAESNFFSDCA